MQNTSLRKIFIAEVVTSQEDRALIQQRMDELRLLVDTYGGFDVVQVVQQRIKPDYKTYL